MKFLTLVMILSGFANGAIEPKILYEEDPVLLTSSIRVIVLTGASEDPLKKNGVTHMLVELMQRGTKKRNRSKFQSELEKIGGSITAGVSHDRVVFEARVIKENTAALLALLEDALINPLFDNKEFENLKKENLAQIAHKKNQNSRLSGLALRKEIFAGTTFEYPVEGGLSTVKAIQSEDIKRAYHDRFHQGNIAFAVASPVKETEMKAALMSIWTKFPDGLRRGRKSIALNIPNKPRLIVIDKPKTSTGSVVFGQAGITAQEKDRYALSVGDFPFGGEPLISRLFKVIRGELGWTYAIGSTYGAMGNLSMQQGLYAISSTPSVEFTGKAVLKVLSMWQDYLKGGLKNAELKMAQESLVNSYPFDFETAEKRLAARIHSFLYDVPILTLEQYSKAVVGLDNDAVRKALSAHHQPDHWIITVVADKKLVEAQLAEEQKERPEAERLTIAKVLTPEQVVQ